MKNVNFKSRKFPIGRLVVMREQYQFGPLKLDKGETGKIIGESYTNLPFLDLFDIRILDIQFGPEKISVSEEIASRCMDEIK